MGVNESREVEGCGGGVESDQEIYRDLLDVDGCETSWRDGGEKRQEELGNADGGVEAERLSRGLDIGQVIATALEDNLEGTPSPENDGNDVRDGLKKVSQIAGNDEPKEATAVTKAERKTKYDGEPSAYLARMRNSIRAQMELNQKSWKLPMSQEGRPITEPPIFNYDRFVREAVPSDKKLMAMLPGDVVLRTKYRDTQTERELLLMFNQWTFPEEFDHPIDDRDSINYMAQYLFYQGLQAEIMVDFKAVSKEHVEILRSFSPLARWEAEYLDNDEDPLTSLRRRLSIGADPFTGYFGGDQAREKYDYLLDELPHRPSHDLTTWTLYTGAYLRSLIHERIQRDGPRSPDHHYFVLTTPFFTHYHYGGEAALEQRRKFKEDALGHVTEGGNDISYFWLQPRMDSSQQSPFDRSSVEESVTRRVSLQFLQYLDKNITEGHPHAEL